MYTYYIIYIYIYTHVFIIIVIITTYVRSPSCARRPPPPSWRRPGDAKTWLE